MTKATPLKKTRYYALVIVTYALSAAFIWQAALNPLYSKVSAIKLTRAIQTPFVPYKPKVVEINGLPNRLVLPDSHVDLSVIPGYYDAASDSWTLSGYDAQFAMISTLPNNVAGQTFIYGHNNNYVFGALRHVTPSVGQPALLYLTNGHILEYSFASVVSVGPTDVTILSYSGKPTLLIQTCTGSLNEWRTEYSYNFVKVVQ